jgi:hypothetical protein
MNEFRKAREDFDKELHAAGNEVNGAAQQPYQPAPNEQPYQLPQNPPGPSQPAAPQNPPSQQPTQPF